jgi:23S rRNA (cytosine1962-C5)-methyltransferase
MNHTIPSLTLLSSPGWEDYELLDSGKGQRLERIGPYTVVRPEAQAVWSPKLQAKKWEQADAIFQPTGEESGGYWKYQRPVESAWKMRYKSLAFWARTAASRHVGFFPEQAVHWNWISERVVAAKRPVNVLNLFGYTGIASLAAAQAGAKVTHVDASKKSVAQARENQSLAGLVDKPIRWIVDDALKFVRREIRREMKYDGLILDPPKFGRGPKGEVWEFFEALPSLLEECRLLFGKQPLFLVITAYAIRASALSLYYATQEMMHEHTGYLDAGELVLQEKSAGRLLSMAIYTRWQADK